MHRDELGGQDFHIWAKEYKKLAEMIHFFAIFIGVFVFQSHTQRPPHPLNSLFFLQLLTFILTLIPISGWFPDCQLPFLDKHLRQEGFWHFRLPVGSSHLYAPCQGASFNALWKTVIIVHHRHCPHQAKCCEACSSQDYIGERLEILWKGSEQQENS